MSSDWDPGQYAQSGRFVADLGGPVLELLASQPGERILDLGCGDGELSLAISRTGARVVGVDASPAMVRAAGERGVDVRLADGVALPFRAEFDAVFSNAALHWMTEPDPVLAGIARALRPGGRFVAEFGGQGNVAAVRTALRAVLLGRGWAATDPWYFPSVQSYRQRLSAAGFAPDLVTLLPRPTVLPGSMAQWLETFARPWLVDVPMDARVEVIDAVSDLLAPALRREDGVWVADYVRLRVSARLITAAAPNTPLPPH